MRVQKNEISYYYLRVKYLFHHKNLDPFRMLQDMSYQQNIEKASTLTMQAHKETRNPGVVTFNESAKQIYFFTFQRSTVGTKFLVDKHC